MDAASHTGEAPRQIGSYRLEKLLGRGGQGVVYLAHDTALDRKVAVKLLTAVGSGSEEAHQRFQREAMVASRLDHPYICPVYAAGVEDGTPFIAMRYVDGKSLAEEIADDADTFTSFEEESTIVDSGMLSGEVDPRPSAPLPGRNEIMARVDLVEKIARGLQVAHDAGVIHRDIKPSNIQISKSGEPVLLDFGLARATSGDLPTLTTPGQLFGTLPYMSPEQLSAPTLTADHRTDVYALGVTLYESVTGRLPFDAPTQEAQVRNILTRLPLDARKINPRVPRDLAVVLAKTLEKLRRHRYQSALALADDLGRVRQSRPIEARPVSWPNRVARYCQRHPVRAGVMAAFLVVLGVVGWQAAQLASQEPEVEKARQMQREQRADDLLQRAYMQLVQENASGAVPLFTEVIDLGLPRVEAVAGLGLAMLRLRQLDDVVALLDRHDELTRDHPAFTRLRAECFGRSGKVDEARALIADLPAPDEPLDLFLEGAIFLEKSHGGNRKYLQRAYEYLLQATRAQEGLDNMRFLTFVELAHAADHLQDATISRDLAAVLTSIWPRSAAAWLLAANALQSTDPARSIASYRECLRLDDSDPGVHHNLAVILSREADLSQAMRHHRIATDLAPENSIYLHAMGCTLYTSGDHDGAIAVFDDAIRYATSPVRRHAISLYRARIAGDWKDAETHARRALALEPNDVQRLIDLAESLDHLGRYGPMVDLLQPHWERGERDARLASCLAAALRQAGRPKDAIEIARTALEIRPDTYYLENNLGMAYADLNRFAEAEERYQRAIAICETRPQAHYNLGNLDVKRRRHGDAIPSYRRAIASEVRDPRPHAMLGLCHYVRDELAEAETAYRAAIAIDPDHVKANTNLGLVLKRFARFDEALAAFETATQAQPRHAQAHANRGLMLLEFGRYDEALGALETAAGLVPPGSNPAKMIGRWVADVRRAIADAARLDDLARGDLEPGGPTDAIRFAVIALNRNRPELAASLAKGALRHASAARPGTRNHLIGCRAALAMASRADTSAELRAQWRELALSWFETEMDGVEELVDAGRLDTKGIDRALRPWLTARELAPVRQETELAKLADDEREQWSKLWSRLHEQL